jgi:hypothetical protein
MPSAGKKVRASRAVAHLIGRQDCGRNWRAIVPSAIVAGKREMTASLLGSIEFARGSQGVGWGLHAKLLGFLFKGNPIERNGLTLAVLFLLAMHRQFGFGPSKANSFYFRIAWLVVDS